MFSDRGSNPLGSTNKNVVRNPTFSRHFSYITHLFLEKIYFSRNFKIPLFIVFHAFPLLFNLFWKRKCNEKCNGKSNIPQSSQGSFPNLNCTPFVDCRQTDLHHFNQPVRHRCFVCSVAKAFISAMASHTISSSTCAAFMFTLP